MFGSRRHRQPSQPLTTATANPSAATAALSAFRRQESPSTTSLSSAAAAAALRARPHTPTNVSEVQTKRTVRRSASSSSHGTLEQQQNARRLERRASSSSMTERTFRTPSPSPHRPASSGSNGHRYTQSADPEDLPPVPSIPRNIVSGQQHRKANSLGFTSQPLKLASQKLGQDAEGSWFGKAAVGNASNVRKSDAIMSSAVSAAKDTPPRPSSRSSSVNFSYPARTRVASPSPSDQFRDYFEPGSEPQSRRRSAATSPTGTRGPRPKLTTASQEPTLVYDPNSRRMVRVDPPEPRIYEVQEAAEKPRPRKKKSSVSKAGSHLSHGTIARPTGTAVPEVAEHSEVDHQQQSSRTQAPAQEAPQSHEAEEDEPAVKAIIGSPKQQHQVESQERTSEPSSSSFLPLVGEQRGNAESQPKEAPVAVDDLVPKVIPAVEPQPGHRQELSAVEAGAASRSDQQYQDIPSHHVIPPTPPAELPAEVLEHPEETEPSEPKVVAFQPRETQAIRQERTHSNSPARAAHFGPVHDSLTVRHSPPPRSISPRKSALKQHSPSRGASPSDDTSETSAPASALASPRRDEPGSQRKKSVRVSFGDDTTVAGTTPDRSTSPASGSPHSARRPWYGSLGIGKKKDALSLDDDEVMKPRPALPSFGSVREKKQREQAEERPLVRPHEPSPPRTASPATNPSITSTIEEEKQEYVGQSSDMAIGSVLSQEQARNPANISRFREPLPPVVTSIEGSGYVSDSSSSSSSYVSDADLIASTPALRQEESAATTIPDTEPVQKSLHIPADVAEGTTIPGIPAETPAEPHTAPQGVPPTKRIDPPVAAVPTISITHPSRERLPEQKAKQMLGVPGTFPDDESDTSTQEFNDASTSHAPFREATFEPVVQQEDAQHTPQTPATVLATHNIPSIEEESDETGSSVYSDAYEDLSDIEGDGFMSLDAVVESPIATSVVRSPFLSKADTPSQPSRTPKPAVQEQAAVANVTLDPAQPEDDWEKAKNYWRSLTSEKRAQLEKEAMEEAAMDADQDETAKGQKKPRRKKSIEKRAAEQRAIQKIQADPERTYMIKPGTKVGADGITPALRKTMRGEQKGKPQPIQEESGTRMRKSLRSNGPPATTPTKGSRPKSMPSPPAAAGAAATRHARAMSDASSTGTAPGKSSFAAPPSLRRRGSDSSESSFRRQRPRTSEGSFGFRRSMRGEPASPASADGGRDRSSRFSLRSLSPTGSGFRQSSVTSSPSGGMGMSMRSTLRESAGAKQSKGGGFFGRSNGSKTQGKSKSKSKGKSSSRFDDSSDEDTRHPLSFNSRFDDSSDDEVVPAKLPPLSIPKTMRSGKSRAMADRSPPLPEEAEESADLSDSDEETGPGGTLQQSNTAGSTNLGTTTIRRSRSGRGELGAATSPTSPAAAPPPGKQQRRGSFMSVLRRRKGDGSKIQRAELTESAARRDTKLERSQLELEAMRSNSLKKLQQQQQQQQTTMPRLQKRMTSDAIPQTNSHWPLSGAHGGGGGEEEEEEQQRPATSDGGGAGAHRPNFLQRRSMSHGVIETEDVGGGEKRKKKKFGALRRMFRLDE